jgi:hypothetical protein
MAHHKKPNGGQRHASERKYHNRIRNHRENLQRAQILGITILALEFRKHQEGMRVLRECEDQVRKSIAAAQRPRPPYWSY